MDGDSQASVSQWLRGLENDDAVAAQKLWERYYAKLVALVAPRAAALKKSSLDAEDVAASVLESLWRGARAGRLSNVKNRDELWWLLLALTQRKLADHHRSQSALKRGKNVKQQQLHQGDSGNLCFEDLLSQEPTAEYLVALEEEFVRLLALLRDDQIRRIAVYKVEGYTNDEISSMLGVSASTTTRKLRLIRSTWAREVQR